MIDLVCPECRSRLVDYLCETCGTQYDISSGIPQVAAIGSDDARQQAAYFDESVDDEFEIERPHGQPRLYERLMHEKFRRATVGIELRGASALVVCGGSGMDAEYLARAGAQVVTSDVSRGAAMRARERARRHAVSYDVIVADVKRLPFADRSFDIVYVHDGLHHIDDPSAGLREMARVANETVCLTEPADAFVTALAVKGGLALEREDAGNRVERLRLDDVRRAVESEGYEISLAQRYGMFYRHEPGAAIRMLSWPVLDAVAISGLNAANRIFGNLGNKLVVQASRK